MVRLAAQVDVERQEEEKCIREVILQSFSVVYEE